IEVLDRRAVELRQYRFERPLGKIVTVLAERLLQNGAAEIEILRALLRADEAADAGPRLAGDDKALPGRRRRLRLRGDDVDLIAVLQPGAQRQQAAVYLGADAGIADLGMDGIGEIDRGRAARQGDQIALWREGEDLILEHFELGVLEKLLRPRGMIEDVEELAQPAILPSVGARLLVLVDPVRGDAELGYLVHVRGADLNFDALAFRPEDAGVQRAVVIRLRGRDVIFEAAGNDVIGRVNNTKRVVALADAVDEHTKRHHVGELLERDVLALHLAPDRIGR